MRLCACVQHTYIDLIDIILSFIAYVMFSMIMNYSLVRIYTANIKTDKIVGLMRGNISNKLLNFGKILDQSDTHCPNKNAQTRAESADSLVHQTKERMNERKTANKLQNDSTAWKICQLQQYKHIS